MSIEENKAIMRSNDRWKEVAQFLPYSFRGTRRKIQNVREFMDPLEVLEFAGEMKFPN